MNSVPSSSVSSTFPRSTSGLVVGQPATVASTRSVIISADTTMQQQQRELQQKIMVTATQWNNEGVRLLSAGSYYQASRYFKDATILMKFMATCDRSTTSSSNLQVHFDRMVQQRDHHNNDNTASAVCDGNGALVPVTSEYDPVSFYSVMVAHVSTNRTSPVHVPIRIDLSMLSWSSDATTSCSIDTNDMEYYTCVIMYNYGVAFDCMAASTTMSGTERKKTLYRKAHSIFQLTNNLLQIQLAKVTRKDYPDRLLQLYAFVTCKRMEMFVYWSAPTEYFDCCTQLEGILRTMETRQRLFSSQDQCAAMA